MYQVDWTAECERRTAYTSWDQAGPFTLQEKIGTDPLKSGTVPINFCKEILELLWGHRRLWTQNSSGIFLQKLWVPYHFLTSPYHILPVV